mgnify:CR=1 FL=1
MPTYDRPFVLAEAAAVASIGTSHALNRLITLSSGVAVDINADQALPSAFYLSHLEVGFTAVTNGAGTTFNAALWWDAAADYMCYGEVAGRTAVVQGLTTTTRYSVIFDLDRYFRKTERSVAGTLYLTLRASAGTADLSDARLHGRA